MTLAEDGDEDLPFSSSQPTVMVMTSEFRHQKTMQTIVDRGEEYAANRKMGMR